MGHAVQLAGSQFLNQGSNFRPLPWTHAVLTTRPPGRPQCIYFAEQQLPLASLQHTQLPWCMCLISAARRTTEPVWAAAHEPSQHHTFGSTFRAVHAGL